MLTEDPKPVKSVCDFIYHWLLTDIQRHETHIVHTFVCYITNTWGAFNCELSLKDTPGTLVQYSFHPWAMYIPWNRKVWPAYNWPLSDIPPSFDWYSTKYLTNMHVPSTLKHSITDTWTLLTLDWVAADNCNNNNLYFP